MSQPPIARLRNLGPKSAEMLRQAGIESETQIRKLGATGCFQLVKNIHPDLSLNFLWAIEGYLLDLDWREIPESRKRDLLTEIDRPSAGH